MFQNPFNSFQQSQNFQRMESLAYRNWQMQQKMNQKWIETSTRQSKIQQLRDQGKYEEARSLESMYEKLDRQENTVELLAKIAEFLYEHGLK